MDLVFMRGLHDGMRWLIVLVGLIALARSLVGLLAGQKFDAIGRVSMSAFSILLTIQFLIGLVFLIWTGSVTGLWGLGLSHMLVMIAAIGVGASTNGRVKRAADDATKWRTGTIGLAISAVLIFVGVMIVGGW